MIRKRKKCWPLFIILGIGLFFLIGYITQLLWNATIADIFKTSEINYWQALMILLLSKILFSSHYNVHRKIRSSHLSTHSPEIVEQKKQDIRVE